MFKNLQLLSIFLFSSFSLLAQTQEEKLAQQYYDEDNFALALTYYQGLSENNPEDLYFYDHYLTCMLELKDFEKAKKFVKKRSKKYENIALFQIDEGYVLDKEGKSTEAEKSWENIISELRDDYQAYNNFSNAFKQRGQYSWAIKVLEKGELTFEGFSDFGSQLALLYMETGNRAKGIEKYVNLVLNSGLPPDQTRQFFEMNLTDSLDYAVLRALLLRQIQKMPDNYLLADLLKWTFIKQKDWNAAFIQTRALDKRLKEDGFRVIELGELCMSNEAWDAASQCFSYVKELGPDKPYFYAAVSGMLETRYSQLASGKADSTQMRELEKEFTDFIAQRGLSDHTWRVVNRLADLYTNYLHQPLNAINLLEDFTTTPGIKPKLLAAAKLVLGDAYVMDGDVWSSELLFAQVDLDFPEEPIGQEAKFRRARLSYYRGDFNWAQIQLNVLKGATTQLISNNAIELALKISENLGIDSNFHALELYARAELFLEQNRLNDAEDHLDSIIGLYPGHVLSDDILYCRAGIRVKQGDFQGAATLYETLAIAFGHDLLADNAWYELGVLYETRLSNPDKALECFKKIVIDFPGSLLHADARRHYRRLRGDQI